MKKQTLTPDRQAGILLHISSLPGWYGTGDLGPEAYNFIDQLAEAGQTYWQILPLNPVLKQTSWSPYTTNSAFAGNTLFISPDKLIDHELASKKMIPRKLKQKGKTDFDYALKCRKFLIDKIYSEFLLGNIPEAIVKKFRDFCEKEKEWLDDFVLFTHLTDTIPGISWNDWPKELKFRDAKTLTVMLAENKTELNRRRFEQFLFFEQWNELKNYAHEKGISLFGDLPIYVGYNSTDVWANPELFALNRQSLTMTGVAGVPPDYFNKNGQLWNMPVYDWRKMRRTRYAWWISRIRKNLELFDLVRLDHFRGFSAFYEVPAGEETAVNGEWKEGPGERLFEAIQKYFPEMPFVAEDLGSIDKPVYDLRDKYGLPGMRIVQFGFGNDIGRSVHILHNHLPESIVYTGTHDNNTTRGWYEKEIDKEGKKRLREYTGVRVKSRNVHTELIRIAYTSVSKVAIVPMQDILGLGRDSRMNTPSTTKGNWDWQMKPGVFTKKHIHWLKRLAEISGRT